MIESTPLRASSPTLFYYLPACLRSIIYLFFASLFLFFSHFLSLFSFLLLHYHKAYLGLPKPNRDPGRLRPVGQGS